MARRDKRAETVFGGAPLVDLLPDRQRAELLHERTMPKLLLAIVLSGLLAGFVWAGGLIPGYFAARELAAAEAESAALIEKTESLSEVGRAVQDLATLGAARAQLTSSEVLFAEVHDEVVAALPEGAVMRRFTGTLASAEDAAEPATEDGAEPSLSTVCPAETATVTVEVSLPTATDVADFIDRLAALTGHRCAVSNEREDVDGGVYTVLIALGPDALADRFKGDGE